MYKTYELSEKQGGRFQQPLINQQNQFEQPITPNYLRSCTDVVCIVILILVIGGFTGILIYALIAGNPAAVVAIHNGDEVRCNNRTTFTFGYIQNGVGVCVDSCPTTTTAGFPCLQDTVACTTGTFTPTFASTSLDSYCIPSSIGNINIGSFFELNSYEEWAYDLREGWPVLLVSVFAAIFLAIIFFVLLRLCTGPIIWIFIIIGIVGMLAIGILCVLQGKDVITADVISQQLSRFASDTLIIAGSCLIGASVLLALLVFCLRSRINIGAKAVELGAMFLISNCFLVILPVFQGFLIIMALAAFVAGGVALLSFGDTAFPNNQPFPDLSFNGGEIAMIIIFVTVSLWLIFFFNGCHQFMLCSAVSVWYFGTMNGGEGSPCGDSLWRLMRYHTGSVTFASFFNGLLFLVKLIANLFSFSTNEDDGCLVATCLKCLSCIFIVFRIFLRYLNDGIYVQMAIRGEGYCTSAYKAYDIISENALKVTITAGISIFFTVMGIIAITAAVAISAYFVVLKLTYFSTRIESPLIITFVSGVIAFLVSAVYLSMIDISAGSVLQCYLVDHERGNGKIRYANERIREIMMYD